MLQTEERPGERHVPVGNTYMRMIPGHRRVHQAILAVSRPTRSLSVPIHLAARPERITEGRPDRFYTLPRYPWSTRTTIVHAKSGLE